MSATDVGRRVSVRARTHVHDGGPSLTDAVGTLEVWTDAEVRIRRRNGSLATVARDDIVAAKVLPPAPPRPDQG